MTHVDIRPLHDRKPTHVHIVTEGVGYAIGAGSGGAPTIGSGCSDARAVSMEGIGGA